MIDFYVTLPVHLILISVAMKKYVDKNIWQDEIAARKDHITSLMEEEEGQSHSANYVNRLKGTMITCSCRVVSEVGLPNK